MEGIRAADNVIAKASGDKDAFGSGNFYIAFLGKPSTTLLGSYNLAVIITLLPILTTAVKLKE